MRSLERHNEDGKDSNPTMTKPATAMTTECASRRPKMAVKGEIWILYTSNHQKNQPASNHPIPPQGILGHDHKKHGPNKGDWIYALKSLYIHIISITTTKGKSPI